jgi:hypothetical protein
VAKGSAENSKAGARDPAGFQGENLTGPFGGFFGKQLAQVFCDGSRAWP